LLSFYYFERISDIGGRFIILFAPEDNTLTLYLKLNSKKHAIIGVIVKYEASFAAVPLDNLVTFKQHRKKKRKLEFLGRGKFSRSNA
jgi:hypothetical protein